MSTYIANQVTRLRTLPMRMMQRSWWRDNWGAAMPWLVFAALGLIWLLLWTFSPSFRATTNEALTVAMSGDQGQIRDYLNGWGAWGPVISYSLMVAQAILAPIPANILQLANGVVFGILTGTIINIVGQFSGSLLSFTIARMLGKGVVEKLAGQANQEEIIDWIYKWGGPALFFMRAIPGLPSDAVSYICGLTRMRVSTYAIASFLGYIPQSLLYAWLGNDASDYFLWIIAAGTGFSILVGVGVWVYRTYRKRQSTRP